MSLLPFGAWLPDLPAFQNPGTAYVLNVVPKSKSYGPLNALSIYSSALTARCQGAYSGKDTSGNVMSFAGDATKLYTLTNTTWGDATRASGGSYSTPNDGFWNFAQFGSDVIAANGIDVLQKFVLGSSTKFAALGGSPPVARYLAVVRDFLVTGWNTSAPQRVRWSAINNDADWTASQTTQSDQQDIVGDHGWVQGLWGGAEFGIIFMERAIYRMLYVGTPVIFQFDKVDGRGCAAPGSIAGLGRLCIFYADDGFFMTDGTGPSLPIGTEQVDATFRADFDSAYWHRISAAIDPINKLYMIAYPGVGHSNGTPNKALIYNLVTKTWSQASFNSELLWSPLSQGYTLDSLDNVSTSLDALGFSLDSRVWTGGAVQFGAFDTSHKLAFFTGSALAATLDTGEWSMDNERMFINGIRPIVDGGVLTAGVGARETPNGTVIYSTATAAGADGSCPQLVSTRYARARVQIASGGTWTHAMGVEPDYQGDGN